MKSIRWLPVLLCAVLSAGQLAGQSQNPEVVLLEKRLAKSLIKVERNQNNLTPLRRLDTLSIAAVSFGRLPNGSFINRLNSYLPVAAFELSVDLPIDQLVSSHNLIILDFNEADSVYLDQLNNFPTSGILVSTSRFWSEEDAFPFAAMINLNSSDSLAYDLAAQVIFGGVAINASGSIDNETSGVRFEYVLPEEMGIATDSLTSRIDSIVQEGLIAEAFPGCQILLAKDQKIFFHRAYGYHTYDRQRPVSKEDIYDLASVTKVTAALPAIMRLNEEGSFNMEATLGAYWEKSGGNKKDLSFREILAHNSGLQAWIPYHKTTKKKNGKFKPKTLSVDSTEEFNTRLADSLFLHKDYKQKIYKMIRKSPVDRDQGYVYSGLTFYLYPEMVKQKSGLEFEHYLKETFYKPLGATTLTFNPLRYYDLDRIVPTELDDFFRNRLLHGVVHDEGAAMMGGVSGNAGLFGTSTDLAKMWQMFLNLGVYGGERYLSNQTVRKFSTCQFCQTNNRRGLGFDKPLVVYEEEKSSVAPQSSPESFGHSGYTGTFVWADPTHGLLYIFLSNRVHPTRDNRGIYELNIRPRIHTVVYETLQIPVDRTSR